MLELKTEEPVWVQRMRARGYNIRVGTGNQPISEIPDAMFPPPVHPVHRTFGRMLRRMQRMLGVEPYGNGRDASLP